jgi:hypothetical protein
MDGTKMKLKQYLIESKLKWKKKISDKWSIDNEEGSAGTIGYQESLRGMGKKGTAIKGKYNILYYDGKEITKRKSPAISDLKAVAQRLQDVMDSENIKDPKKAIEWIKRII